MSVPSYHEGDDLTNHAEEHGIEKGDTVRQGFGGETAEAVEFTQTYIEFDNGEKHTHLQLAKSVNQGALEIVN